MAVSMDEGRGKRPSSPSPTRFPSSVEVTPSRETSDHREKKLAHVADDVAEVGWRKTVLAQEGVPLIAFSFDVQKRRR